MLVAISSTTSAILVLTCGILLVLGFLWRHRLCCSSGKKDTSVKGQRLLDVTEGGTALAQREERLQQREEANEKWSRELLFQAQVVKEDRENMQIDLEAKYQAEKEAALAQMRHDHALELSRHSASLQRFLDNLAERKAQVARLTKDAAVTREVHRKEVLEIQTTHEKQVLAMKEKHAQHQLAMQASMTTLTRTNVGMYLETHAQIYGYRYSDVELVSALPCADRTLLTCNFTRFYSKCKPPKVGIMSLT